MKIVKIDITVYDNNMSHKEFNKTLRELVALVKVAHKERNDSNIICDGGIITDDTNGDVLGKITITTNDSQK
jgi:hypothetical protein